MPAIPGLSRRSAPTLGQALAEEEPDAGYPRAIADIRLPRLSTLTRAPIHSGARVAASTTRSINPCRAAPVGTNSLSVLCSSPGSASELLK